MPKDEEEKRAEREPRCKYAKYIFIFDDISDELKMKSYVALMKKARHYCILTITSTQDAKDITPATVKQMRLWLLFKGIDDERLMHIYSKLGKKLSFADFKRLYDQAHKIIMIRMIKNGIDIIFCIFHHEIYNSEGTLEIC